MVKIKSGKMIYWVMLLGLGVTFFFVIGDSGPYEMRDSQSFINPTSGLLQNYWLYPHFLALCRNVLGNTCFLYGAYVIQGVLALISSVCLTEYFRKQFRLDYVVAIAVFVCTLLPYGYSLPENVVTHHILTEALAIPIFHFCFLLLCKGMVEKKNYCMILALACGSLLWLSRSQMALFFAVILLFNIAFYGIKFYGKMKEKVKKSQFIIGMAILICVITLVGTRFVLFGTSISSQLLDAVSGRVMCLMTYEDRDLFMGETQEIYDALYVNADEGGHLRKYFRTDSWVNYDIAEHTNENTKEVNKVIGAFYGEKYPDTEIEEFYTKIVYNRKYIIKAVLQNHIWEYVITSFQLMIGSCVSSIFIQPDAIRNLCYVIAMCIYCVTVLAMCMAKKGNINKTYMVPMYITLTFLFSNVIILNLIFYGQQRYVIYTFGMFYLSWIIMLKGIYRKRKANYEESGECNNSGI